MPAHSGLANTIHRSHFVITPNDTSQDLKKPFKVTYSDGRTPLEGEEIFPPFAQVVNNLVNPESSEVKDLFDAVSTAHADTPELVKQKIEILRDIVWNLEQIRDHNKLEPSDIGGLNLFIKNMNEDISRRLKASNSQAQPEKVSEAQQADSGSVGPSVPMPAIPDRHPERIHLQQQLERLEAEHGALYGELVAQHALSRSVNPMQKQAALKYILRLESQCEQHRMKISEIEEKLKTPA